LPFLQTNLPFSQCETPPILPEQGVFCALAWATGAIINIAMQNADQYFILLPHYDR